MEFKVNEGTVMNMQSEGCKVYNEALFTMPYKIKNSEGKEEAKVHVWHAGIVSYIIMDFHSEEIHDDYPKYIMEHGHKSVMVDKADLKGTMKQFPDNKSILDKIEYAPSRPISFFEVYNQNNINMLTVHEDINKRYSGIFGEINANEIAQKLIEAYANTLHLKDSLMKGHPPEDNLVVYYGEPNQIFLDILAQKSGLVGNKIYEFKGLGFSDKRG